MTERTFTRRNALFTGATATVALPLLAACGGSDEAANDVPSSAPSTPDSSTPSAGTSTSGRPTTPALAKVTDIPEGGGKIFGDENVVVTQPTAGEFKAFDATCTHQGCIVAKVSDGEINCTCHGSKFSIEDGSVDGGPARAPLSKVGITVTDGEIFLS
jgi:nitrite reductase/ring-hydroxylating ferredoxin subunit